MYDGLLLDHDGVIVTLGDESALRAAARNAFRDAGVADPAPGDVETLRIRVSESDLLRVSRRYDLDPERLWRHRDDRVREALLAEVRADSKVPYDDVDALGRVRGPLGVVSNNQTRIVERVLDHYDLGDHFGTVRARAPHPDSLGRKKPSPTFLDEAMADLGIERERRGGRPARRTRRRVPPAGPQRRHRPRTPPDLRGGWTDGGSRDSVAPGHPAVDGAPKDVPT
jgi:phosphoglycolate phosphatase-like HAD superfamily hydrolase